MESLVIPESLKELGNGAFTLNEISDLQLSKNLKVIPTAFGYNNLTNLTIPEGVTKIENMAFSDNKLVKVNLPSTLKYLSGFNNNKIESITIPKGVKELGKKAFARNNIKAIVIPGNVKVVEESTFNNTWHDEFITSLIIEDGVEKIGRYAFSLNHLKDVNLPDSVTELASSAFNKNLGYNGVVHLFTQGHKNINHLKESKYHIIDPAKLTIQYRCDKNILKEEELWINPLTKTYFHIGDKDVEIVPDYENNEYELIETNAKKVYLNNKENKLIFKCRKKKKSENLTIKSIGKVAPIVVNLTTSKEKAIERLPKETFIVDSNDTKHKVILNWKLQKYDGNKLGEYSAIGTFNLPTDILQCNPPIKEQVIGTIIVKDNFNNIDYSNWSVEDFTFKKTILSGFSDKGKAKLKTNTELILPKTNEQGKVITKVENYAFKNQGLTGLIIPEGINELIIGTNAFEENKLNKVYIPEGVKEIDAYAFNSNELRYIDFPATLKKIGNNAFANNELVSAEFSKNVKNIALDRFSFYNNKLTSITLLNEVKKVNGEAFKDNESCSEDGKVHIYTLSFDPNNCNEWFPNSKYHQIISLRN